VLNQEAIKKIIPHRDPFLFVDEVKIIEPLKHGLGYKKVREDELFFKGHFPGQPVMPGVLIVEAMSQVGATVLLSDDNYKGKLVLFVGADNIKFRRQVVPGDTLKMEIEIIKLRGNFGSAQGRAYVDDELACEGVVKFAVVEKE
jgi:3-hydroxyacyl-[acyl-carrier-protein] dehydratase